MRGYYFITDTALSRAGNENDVRCAVAAGVQVIQYRSKEATTRELCVEAAALRGLCGGATFLVNDRVDVALAVGADGVHLGQDDMPLHTARRLLGRDRIIGVTVHTLGEAIVAAEAGADYLGLSPIFQTRTKADAGFPSGLGLIAEIRRATQLPLVAIGGITLANAADVIRAGADGLCAISAIVTAQDVRGEIEKFQRLFTIS